MPRTIWEWLEIEETTDRNLIRKAYARQAAKYHPEEAPEEAQQLREAYKRALALADRKVKSAASEMEDDELLMAPLEGTDELHRQAPEHQEKAEQDFDAGSYQHGHKEDWKEARQDSGQTHDYQYGNQGEQKEAEQDSGQAHDYQYSNQGEQKDAEQDSGQPRKYRYGNQEGQKEARQDSGQARNYRYEHQEEQKEAKQDSDRVRSYRYDHYEEKKDAEQETNSGSNRNYQFQTQQIDPERVERGHRLGKRLIDLYGSPAYRYSKKLWSEAVREYLTKEDLQDPFLIAILISFLERIPGLNHRIWKTMERELFRYSRKEAEWIQLKNYFADARRISGIRSRAEQEQSRSGTWDSQAERSGGMETAVPRKTNGRLLRVVLVIAALFVMHMGNRLKEEQERKQQFQEMVNSSISGEVLITQRPDADSSLQGQQRILPGDYYIDLNDDRFDDRIRYDDEKGSYTVEYYDPVTGTYTFQGTVDQYLEENPDSVGSEQLQFFKSQS